LPQDQVDDCLDRDIDAVVWNSETDEAVKSRIVQVSCFVHMRVLSDMRWPAARHTSALLTQQQRRTSAAASPQQSCCTPHQRAWPSRG